MSTRNFIALRSTDKTITAVYCHWDGYLEHAGRILLEHYWKATKLRDLLAQGAISSLDAKIGSQHDFNDSPDGQTTIYARDRGDPLIVHTVVSLDGLLKVAAAKGPPAQTPGHWEPKTSTCGQS